MRKNEAEMINAEEAKPIDWGVLMLAVHQPLVGVFALANFAAYPITRALAQSGHNELLTVVELAAFAGNFYLQWDTYRRTNVTPNLTAMIIREKFHLQNVLLPMAIGYTINTIGQIGGTPGSWMNVLEHRNLDSVLTDALPAQLIAGFITSYCASALIRSGKLKPVANWIGDKRQHMNERVTSALTKLGERRETLSRYDE